MAIDKEKDSLSSFGERLYDLMIEADCKTPFVLADALISQGLVSVNQKKSSDATKKNKNAKDSVARKIRKHLHGEDATCLQGEFVNAYCRFFHCSSDYLFGYTDIKTPNIDARKICELTELSEKVVLRLIEDASSEETIHRCDLWSQILESELYYGIVYNWLRAGGHAIEKVKNNVERIRIEKDLKNAVGPDILDLENDLEGVKSSIETETEAYLGLLYNISYNLYAFVQSQIEYTLNDFSDQITKSIE